MMAPLTFDGTVPSRLIGRLVRTHQNVDRPTSRPSLANRSVATSIRARQRALSSTLASPKRGQFSGVSCRGYDVVRPTVLARLASSRLNPSQMESGGGVRLRELLDAAQAQRLSFESVREHSYGLVIAVGRKKTNLTTALGSRT